MEALARPEQDARLRSDAWQDLILDWCETPSQLFVMGLGVEPWFESKPGRVVSSDVLLHGLKLSPAQIKPGDNRRVGDVLRRAGWAHKQLRIPGIKGEVKKWFYVKETDGVADVPRRAMPMNETKYSNFK